MCFDARVIQIPFCVSAAEILQTNDSLALAVTSYKNTVEAQEIGVAPQSPAKKGNHEQCTLLTVIGRPHQRAWPKFILHAIKGQIKSSKAKY